MSTTAPITERTVTAVLLSLWKRPDSTIQQLLRDTLAPLPDVQEALNALTQRGCLIERTPTSIRLVSTGLPCWRDILEDFSRTRQLRLGGGGRGVAIYNKTTSTNDIAWQHATAPAEETDGLVILADEQTAGRGRLGHSWLSKPEQSILLSILLHNMPDESIDHLTLLAGLAAAQALEEAANIPTHIKWPNDILLASSGKKLAGILVERKNASIVLGIGINVSQSAADFPHDIAPRATSLYQATGNLLDRLRIVTLLLRELDRRIATPAADNQWLDEWKSRCAMLGQRVTARSNENLLTGQILDIDPLRGLLLRDDTGATHFLSAQTTTLSQ